MSDFNNMDTYMYIAHTQFTRNPDIDTQTQELTLADNLRKNNLGTCQLPSLCSSMSSSRDGADTDDLVSTG